MPGRLMETAPANTSERDDTASRIPLCDSLAADLNRLTGKEKGPAVSRRPFRFLASGAAIRGCP
jgi:hypothetical protein